MIEVEISTLDIERLTGKKHFHILRDVKDLIQKDSEYQKNVKWGEYKDSMGRLQPLAFISGELLEVFKIKHLYEVTIRDRKVREDTTLLTIEQLLDIKLEREYMVNINGTVYLLDGYDVANNVAYEVDEPYHFIDGELRSDCVKRQADIESYLGCKFVRIKV